jgi:zinc transporter
MTELAPRPPLRLAAEVIPGLIWGFRGGSDGACTPIAGDRVPELPVTGWVWLHLNLADQRARTWLASSPLVPRDAVETLLSTDDTQLFAPASDRFVGVVFDIAHGFSRDSDDFGHLRFVLDERILVSGRRRPLNSVEAVRREMETGRRFNATTDILQAIVDQLSTGLDKFVAELAVEVDSIEDSILGELDRDERQRLGRLRLATVRIHRHLNGLRAVLRRAGSDAGVGVAGLVRTSLAGLLQRLEEVDHDVVEVRDRARLLQEEITLKLAEQTNRHLHVLSILTALLLPPALVAGLFGMNLGGMPFLAGGHGFWWAVAVALLTSGIALWVLRRMGVLRRQPRT